MRDWAINSPPLVMSSTPMPGPWVWGANSTPISSPARFHPRTGGFKMKRAPHHKEETVRSVLPILVRCFCLALALALAPLHVAAAADAFYKGKSVTFVIGSAAGGGYDTYSRLLASHMGRHLDGQPQVIPQNMPGAGSIRAANYLYNAARKDGTV